jgi:hypothetical protein
LYLQEAVAEEVETKILLHRAETVDQEVVLQDMLIMLHTLMLDLETLPP